ncbi:hypothetical protein PoB_000186600 [Plakobranchus ocellatus]|uniref:Uncharacterized protein n=1 Tax=Plakobranchus ocellatus TaxID=259542 RepID=A0AAV3XX10_9GAST|nr:hypothetical protein PoB_000186600 [Plakobranchus ocellatus]
MYLLIKKRALYLPIPKELRIASVTGEDDFVRALENFNLSLTSSSSRTAWVVNEHDPERVRHIHQDVTTGALQMDRCISLIILAGSSKICREPRGDGRNIKPWPWEDHPSEEK